MNDPSMLLHDDVRKVVSAFGHHLRSATQDIIYSMDQMRNIQDIDTRPRFFTTTDGRQFMEVVPAAVPNTQIPAQAYPAIPHTLPNAFSHQMPSSQAERIMWRNNISEKEAYLRQLEANIQQLENNRNTQYHQGMNLLAWKIQRAVTDATAEIGRDMNLVLRNHARLLHPLQIERSLTKKRIELIGAFISPIRKLPLELKTYILSYASGDLPKRDLALVCKEWRAIILDTPTFWRKIDTSVIKHRLRGVDCKHAAAELTQRLLQLSGGVDIDVVIDFIYGHHVEWLTSVCPPLASYGVDKWRSLEIRRGSLRPDHTNIDEASSIVHGLIIGRFGRLQVLTISVNRDDSILDKVDMFCPLYERIAQTAPPLRSLTVAEVGHHGVDIGSDIVMNKLAGWFQESPVLGQLQKLHSPASFFSQLKDINLQTVNDLALTKYSGQPPIAMAQTTTLCCKLEDLVECNRDRAEKLTIHLPGELQKSVSLSFTSLEELAIHGIRFLEALTDLVAPKLQRLVLVGPEVKKLRGPILPLSPAYIRRFEQFNHDAIEQVFKTNKDKLHVAPTHLELSLPVSVKPLITVLENWPQIEYLKLYWSDHFKANDRFPQALRRDGENGAIGPNLQELHIEMDSWKEEKVAGWREIAMNILEGRVQRGLPLSKIAWTVYNRGKPPCTGCITRDDIQKRIDIDTK